MTLQNPDASPLTINTDYYGTPIVASKVVPGPFQNLTATAKNYVLWPKGQSATIVPPFNRNFNVPANTNLRQHGKMLLVPASTESGRISDIVLTDLSGAVVRQFMVSGAAEHAFSLEKLGRGVYFATEKSGGQSFRKASVIRL